MDNTNFATLSKKRFTKGRRKIGNNTYAYDNGTQIDGERIISVYYHDNMIASLTDNVIYLTDQGWNTVTTRARLHQIIGDNNVPFYWNSHGVFRNMYPFSQQFDTKDYAVTERVGYGQRKHVYFRRNSEGWFDAS
jgi:hypothetical protein